MVKYDEEQSNLKHYETSVVQILNTGISYDYKYPYKSPESAHCAGSGFVIQDPNGKNFILTNAHVVENSTFTEVQLSNDDTRYEATIKKFGHDCDLALLDVNNPKFWNKTKPLKLGKMVQHKQSIKVVGFPKGGEEISITQGIVSRIEVDEYEHSGKSLLQVQVDAAINNGNSGGPVFYRNKVIGVAFQGDPSGESLGYIIPTPIIEHFLYESFNQSVYQGFPTPDFITQSTSNAALRQELNMKEEHSGLLVTHVPKLSTVFSILKPNDIILSINKYKLSNMGFISLPFDKHIHFSYLFHQKFYGDSIKIKIIRGGKILSIQVTLKYNPVGNKVILPFERDKAPCFYIHSGIIFQPVTQNYMVEESGEYTESGNYLLSSGQMKAKEERVSSDQQYVIINSILACNKTSGYQHISDTLITHVNYIKINNIYDLIKIILQSTSPRLVLSTKNKDLIVIEKMSLQEQAILLKKKYGIERRYSKDLSTYINQCNLLFIKESLDDDMSSVSSPVIENQETKKSHFHQNNFEKTQVLEDDLNKQPHKPLLNLYPKRKRIQKPSENQSVTNNAIKRPKLINIDKRL